MTIILSPRRCGTISHTGRRDRVGLLDGSPRLRTSLTRLRHCNFANLESRISVREDNDRKSRERLTVCESMLGANRHDYCDLCMGLRALPVARHNTLARTTPVDTSWDETTRAIHCRHGPLVNLRETNLCSTTPPGTTAGFFRAQRLEEKEPAQTRFRVETRGAVQFERSRSLRSDIYIFEVKVLETKGEQHHSFIYHKSNNFGARPDTVDQLPHKLPK